MLSQLQTRKSFIFSSLSLYWTTTYLSRTIILKPYKNHKPCTEHSSTSCKTEILTFLLYWTKAPASKASYVCSQSLKYLLSVIVLSLCLVFCCCYFCSHCESSYPHVFLCSPIHLSLLNFSCLLLFHLFNSLSFNCTYLRLFPFS